MKDNTPRRKRLNKKSRLVRANYWIKSYNGKDIVKGYAKWFGVDWLCALHELKLAGVFYTEEDEQRILKAYQQRMEDKARRKRKSQPVETLYESDEHFAFIAGYTSNGAPYGLTHQEMKNIEDEPKKNDDTNSDLPLPW